VVRGGTLCLCNCEIIPELAGEPVVGFIMCFQASQLSCS